MLLATHSLHFRVHTRVLLTLLVAFAVATVLWGAPSHHPLPCESTAIHQSDQPTQVRES